jgi:hypothetical protein
MLKVIAQLNVVVKKFYARVPFNLEKFWAPTVLSAQKPHLRMQRNRKYARAAQAVKHCKNTLRWRHPLFCPRKIILL